MTRSLKLVLFGLVLPIVLVSCCVGYLLLDFNAYTEHLLVLPRPNMIFTISPGESFPSITRRLHQAHVIQSPLRFTLLAKFERRIPGIKAGEFELTGGLTPRTLLDLFSSNNFVTYKITVPEGYDLYDIAKLFEEKLGLPRKSFLALARDFRKEPKLATLPLPQEASSFEGFLFPETYRFSKNNTATEILTIMASTYRKVFDAQFAETRKVHFLSEFELVTLASIIEKETGVAEERGLISSVFHNRRIQGMLLQSDPTVIYGLKPGFNGNLTRKDLTTPTDYNTYTRKGLPIGPICNPGIHSLRAALFPDDTQYLYFVARHDRTHHFSTTLAEHNEAVWRYQLGR